MKKIGVTILCGLLLTGCTNYNPDLSVVVNEKLAEVMEEPAGKPYYNSEYYHYYVSPEVGRITSDQTSNTFMVCNTQFVMNLNVEDIIASTYYQTSAADSSISGLDLVVDTAGSFVDYDANSHEYTVRIYNEGLNYYTIVSTDYVDFYALSGKYEAAEVATEMLRIARSVRVSTDKVLTAFSNRKVMTYNRKKVELFQNIAPENGVIQELFENGGNSDTQTNANGGTLDGNYATDNYPDTTATPVPTATPEEFYEDEGDPSIIEEVQVVEPEVSATPLPSDTPTPTIEASASPEATLKPGQLYSEISDGSVH